MKVDQKDRSLQRGAGWCFNFVGPLSCRGRVGDLAHANILAIRRKWLTKILEGQMLGKSGRPSRIWEAIEALSDPFYNTIRCQVGESLDGPRWCSSWYKFVCSWHRGRVEAPSRLASMGLDGWRSTRLHRGWPRWASIGGANG